MWRSYTQATVLTRASSGARDKLHETEERHLQNFITSLRTPEWAEMLFAASGVSAMHDRVEKERERREDSYFVNPFIEIQEFVDTTRFEVAVGGAILINCVLLGWQASLESDSTAAFSVFEHFFVALFFLEWCLRMLAFGWVWVFETMNFCDTILVFGTGVLPKWVIEPSGWDAGFLRVFSVLRVFRLARLAKAVRFMPAFEELWILIQGLAHSLRPLLWTFVIALILLYVFAVAATELVGRRREFEQDDHVQERFGNVLRSMLTMFQLMTLDSWGFDVARPVMVEDSAIGLFFVAFIGVGVFIFWNLITAVIVENAYNIIEHDSAHQAKATDQQKKRDLKALTDLFIEIDKDGSGELSTQEFMGAMENRKVRTMLDVMELKVSDLARVWDLLDDGDGLLSIREFTSGLRRMKGEAKAKDVVDSIKSMRQTTLSCAEVGAQVDQCGSSLKSLEKEVVDIAKDAGEIVGLFQEVYHRLQVHIDTSKRQDAVAKRQRKREAWARRAEADAAAAGDDLEEAEELLRQAEAEELLRQAEQEEEGDTE